MNVPEQHRPILAKLSTLDDDSIERVQANLKKSPPSRGDILTALVDPAAFSRDDAETLLRALLSMRRSITAHDEDVAGFAQSVALSPDLTLEDPDRDVLEKRLVALLTNPTLETMASTVDARAAYSHRLHSASLFTDLRPVFRKGDSEIAGASVIHVLNLDVMTGYDTEFLTIALDDDDLDSLEKAISVAKERGVAVRKAMDRLDVRTTESGDLA